MGHTLIAVNFQDVSVPAIWMNLNTFSNVPVKNCMFTAMLLSITYTTHACRFLLVFHIRKIADSDVNTFHRICTLLGGWSTT